MKNKEYYVVTLNERRYIVEEYKQVVEVLLRYINDSYNIEDIVEMLENAGDSVSVVTAEPYMF